MLEKLQRINSTEESRVLQGLNSIQCTCSIEPKQIHIFNPHIFWSYTLEDLTCHEK